MNRRKLFMAAGAAICLTSTAYAADTGAIVTAAMTEISVNKNVAAVDTYFAEPYIQHNQTVPTGLEAFKGLLGAVVDGNPDFSYELVRVIADGDIGIAHGVFVGFGPVPLVAFDVFRVEDGKIVEHWDNLAPVGKSNPSGHSQTDGATDIADLDLTDTNKALVGDFVTEVMIGGAFERLGEFFDGDAYIQHNSNIADGVSGLGAGLQALAEAGITMRIAKLHNVYGQGNFVLAISEGDINGQPTAFYDLFRVEAGKIAEHWDIISPILPDDQAANANGKF